MITMSVREDEEVQVRQPDARLLRIGKEQPRQAGIKEYLLSGSFQKERESGLATVVVVHEGCVINENGEGEPGHNSELSYFREMRFLLPDEWAYTGRDCGHI
jgi:hypothetical protein